MRLADHLGNFVEWRSKAQEITSYGFPLNPTGAHSVQATGKPEGPLLVSAYWACGGVSMNRILSVTPVHDILTSGLPVILSQPHKTIYADLPQASSAIALIIPTSLLRLAVS